MPVRIEGNDPKKGKEPEQVFETLPMPDSPPPSRSRSRENAADESDSGEESEYKVGYRKPPEEHQFKKGGPGGPGRPKGSKNRETLLLAQLREQVDVNIDGESKRMSKLELIIRRLVNSAIKGDLKSIAFINQLLDKFMGTESREAAPSVPLTDAELAIAERLLRDDA